MFKAPFSFEGRIRRLEYGISYLIYLFFNFLTTIGWQELQNSAILVFLIYVVLLWFFFAQGAKRAHDLGNSGFYQFIPLYTLWQIFQEGEQHENTYGQNPKTKNGTEKTNVKEKDYMLKMLVEISSAVLLNILIIAIAMEYLYTSSGMLLLWIIGAVVLCYFIMLLLNYRGFRLTDARKLLFQQRIMYSTVLYVLLRLYTLVFRNSEIDIDNLFFEACLIVIFLGSTYFPYLTYKLLFKKNEVYER